MQNHEYRFSFNAGFFPNLHCLKFLPFQPPLHPMSSDRVLHARKRARILQIMPARAKRKRTGKAVASRISKNNLACLRGAVSGGAEEMIFFCGPVRAVAQACHSACQCECICRLSMCTYASLALARAGRLVGYSAIICACKAQQRSRTAGAAGTAKSGKKLPCSLQGASTVCRKEERFATPALLRRHAIEQKVLRTHSYRRCSSCFFPLVMT